MKVLFIEPCHVNFGGYFRARNICTYLSKNKIQVDLLVASGKKFSLTIIKTQINPYFTQYELPRYYFHFFLNGRILRGIIALAFGLFRKYDIIHACVPVQLESNIPAFFLKLLGKKVVMDWDDYWEGSSIYGEYPIMKKYVAWCEQKAPAYFGNMVVVSEFLKTLSRKRGAKKILKLINGINTTQFEPHSREEGRRELKLNPKGKYLLTFGHTYINDRAYLLFKTFEHIYNIDPSIILLFNEDPKRIIKEQGLENKISEKILKNIKTVGYIPQDKLGYYLGAADITIFLMGDADNERACFPIRIGSYLNGEAIIAINDIDAEATNVLKEYKCAIVEKDIHKLSKKIVQTIDSPPLQRKYTKNILRAKHELSWDILITDLIKFYRRI
jgi:glycosyltransferase involved in cell wall biosynthesis